MKLKILKAPSPIRIFLSLLLGIVASWLSKDGVTSLLLDGKSFNNRSFFIQICILVLLFVFASVFFLVILSALNSFYVGNEKLQQLVRKIVLNLTDKDAGGFQSCINLHFLLLVSALIFLVSLGITRWFFFFDYPLPGIYDDSLYYYQLALEIGRGFLPNFSIRAPIYPLFMRLVFVFSDRVMAIIFFQNLFSAISGLCLIYSVYRFKRSLAPYAAFVMAGFVSGATHTLWNTTLMADSLYTDWIVLAFAFLFLGIATGKPAFWACASIAMAGSILTRPNGLFLLVTFLMVAAFLAWNQYKKNVLLAFGLPLPLLLLGLCFYNYFTIHIFAINAWGETNLAGVTMLFWEKDDHYPLEINAGIDRIERLLEDQNGVDYRRKILTLKYDSPELYRILLSGFSYKNIVSAMQLGGNDFTENQNWMRAVSLDAIKKHPEMYQSIVKTQLLQYFDNSDTRWDFIDTINERSYMFYLHNQFPPLWSGYSFAKLMAREYATPPLINSISVVGSGADAHVVVTETAAWRIYHTFVQARDMLFAQPVWFYLYLLVFGVSAVKLVWSKGRHKGAFVLFALTSNVLGAALLTCLVEVALPRYSYPTEFAYYLSVVLSPLLIMREQPIISTLAEV